MFRSTITRAPVSSARAFTTLLHRLPQATRLSLRQIRPVMATANVGDAARQALDNAKDGFNTLGKDISKTEQELEKAAAEKKDQVGKALNEKKDQVGKAMNEGKEQLGKMGNAVAEKQGEVVAAVTEKKELGKAVAEKLGA